MNRLLFILFLLMLSAHEYVCKSNSLARQARTFKHKFLWNLPFKFWIFCYLPFILMVCMHLSLKIGLANLLTLFLNRWMDQTIIYSRRKFQRTRFNETCSLNFEYFDLYSIYSNAKKFLIHFYRGSLYFSKIQRKLQKVY